ncbi:MAG TPA: ATP-binding protein [Desulfobacterales bacterium]
MAKFTLLKRLTLGYVVILILVIMLGVYVAVMMNQLNRLIRGTASDGITLSRVENLRATLFSQAGFEKKYFISKDEDFRKQFWEIRDRFEGELAEIEGRFENERERKLFSEAIQLYDNYVTLFTREAERIASGETAPSRRYSEASEATLDGITQKMNAIIDLIHTARENKIQTSNRYGVRVWNMTVFTALLTVIVGTLISFFNTRKINRSILMLRNHSREIAKGNYVTIPVISGPPEIQELAEDFNRMSAKLKELDEMKIDFINHVSHELRTPLTAIKEASEMLLEGTYTSSPERQLQLLTINKEECERLISSVNRILDFSRMEAKMVQYRFRKCSLVPVLQRSVLKLAPMARNRGIQLELKPLPNLPLVAIDEELICQVLENLIANALKYTGRDGRVTVQSTHQPKRKTVCVAVSDTGIGISNEHLNRIFDKFSRIETDDDAPAGSGLGLAIAKHIINNHRGEIWARSKPGQGSTFYFALPA